MYWARSYCMRVQWASLAWSLVGNAHLKFGFNDWPIYGAKLRPLYVRTLGSETQLYCGAAGCLSWFEDTRNSVLTHGIVDRLVKPSARVCVCGTGGCFARKPKHFFTFGLSIADGLVRLFLLCSIFFHPQIINFPPTIFRMWDFYFRPVRRQGGLSKAFIEISTF